MTIIEVTAEQQAARDLQIRQRQADTDRVRRALIRQFRAGVDVGEFLVEAVVAAQEQLTRQSGYEWLTSNRPGSWEGAILEQMLESGGC